MVKKAADEFQLDDSLDHPRKAFIPLFGSQDGRLRQSCTQRWKVAAIRQQARKLGAQTMRAAQGIHADEAKRRVKGVLADGWDDFITHFTT
jgi:hypothetical protein